MNRLIIVRYWFVLQLGILLVAQLSCKKFVEIPSSPNLIQTKELFESDATALSAVLGVYAQLRSMNPSYLNGTISIYAGLGADELVTISSSSEYDAFHQNAILSTSTVVGNQLWASAYRVIYRTNAIIEGLERSANISTKAKAQFTGEMKTIRAISFFYLTNLFGDVPLITTTDVKANEGMSRTATELVSEQIIKDLTDAVNALTEAYPSTQRVRINKYVAAALLSRVYLYQQEWEKAEMISTSIINAGLYNLPENLDMVFKSTSNETIWQIAPINESRNTVEGGIFVPVSSLALPSIFLSSSLLTSFEEQDKRRIMWTGTSIINGTQYVYPNKYKRRVASPVDEYTILFRMAEQYLIRAEARMHQEKFEEAVADLNLIRTRAGLPPIISNDKDEIRSAIHREKRIEFFSELGHRWFDLKRTGEINPVLIVEKGELWQPTDAVYPIPFNEIQFNPNLIQNPGY